MPIILEGNFIPVAHTINSPSPKHPKIIKNALAICLFCISCVAKVLLKIDKKPLLHKILHVRRSFVIFVKAGKR